MADEIVYTIRTKADTSGFDAVKREAEGMGDSARKAQTGFKSLGDGIDDSGKKAQSSGGLFKSLGGSMGGVASIASGFVVGQGIQQLGGYLFDAAKGAADDEAATKRLQQAVKNLGGDYDATLKSVDDAIAKGQKLAFTDDEIRDSYQSLAAATGNSEEALQRLAAAQDLARGANIPLATATRLLGKLNEDNVEVFKRMGIVIGENASEADALAAVQAKFGGQAETFAKSTAGQFEQSKIAMAEFQETVGTVILPVITNLVQIMATGAPKIQAWAGNFAAIVAGGQPLLSLLTGIFGAIKNNEPVMAGLAAVMATVAAGIVAGMIPALIAWTAATVAQTTAQIAAAAAFVLANAPLIALVAAIGLVVAGVVLLIQHWDQITEKVPLLGTLAGAAGAALSKLADIFGVVAGAITSADLGEKAQDALAWLTEVDLAAKAQAWIAGLWEGMQAGWDAGVSFLTGLGQSVLDAIGDLTSTLWQKGQDLITGLARGYVELWTAEINFFIKLGQTVFDAIGDVTSWLWQKGQDLIAGLYRGVKELWATEVAFYTNLGATILTAIGDLASTLWQKGQDLIAGLKRGWSELWDREVTFWTNLGATVLNAVGDLASTLFNTGWDLITGMINGAKSVGQDLIDTVKGFVQGAIDAAWEAIKPGSPSREGHAMMVNLFEGMISGASSMGQALKDKMVSLAQDALDALKSTLGGAAGAIGGAISGAAGAIGGALGGGGDVTSWLQQAMRIAGVGPDWLAGLQQLVQLESGGNPNAVNPTAVIQGGVNYGHATGLLQTLPGTFAAYNTTGGSITDPVANAVAAIEYIKRTYGHVNNAVANHAARGGYAGGGTVAPGWFTTGEQGWEFGHLGPDGLRIFSHAQSQAMISGLSGGSLRGFAAGSGATPGGSRGDNTQAELFAAFAAGTNTPETWGAWTKGMQQIAQYMADEAEAIAESERQLAQVNLGAELRRFAAWVRDFGDEWLKALVETEGVEAAFQAYHGRSSGSMAMLPPGGGQQALIAEVRALRAEVRAGMTLDGRRVSAGVEPYMSESMANRAINETVGYA